MFSKIVGIVAIVIILGILYVLFENAKFNQACDKGDLEYVKTKLSNFYYIDSYLSSVFNKDSFILYINRRYYITHSILLNIVKNKEFDLIKFIIEKNKDQLVICLTLACERGEIDLFTYLLENYTISEDDFEDALNVAIENHQIDIVKLFVEKQIKINKEPDSNISKLIEIAQLLAK